METLLDLEEQLTMFLLHFHLPGFVIFECHIIRLDQSRLVLVAFGLALCLEIIVARRTNRLLNASRLSNLLKVVHILKLQFINLDKALLDAWWREGLTARFHYIFSFHLFHFYERLSQLQKFFVTILKLGKLRL